MPKRKSSRRKAARPSWIAPALLVVTAIAVGWFLFRPVHRIAHKPHHRVAVATATPEASASPEPSPSATATASAAPSASPTASPSASPTASPSVLPAIPGGPKLALIVDDCGQWVATERGFIALPIPITLSVLPDVHATTTIMREAADAGKGVMLHLPMETISRKFRSRRASTITKAARRAPIPA